MVLFFNNDHFRTTDRHPRWGGALEYCSPPTTIQIYEHTSTYKKSGMMHLALKRGGQLSYPTCHFHEGVLCKMSYHQSTSDKQSAQPSGRKTRMVTQQGIVYVSYILCMNKKVNANMVLHCRKIKHTSEHNHTSEGRISFVTCHNLSATISLKLLCRKSTSMEKLSSATMAGYSKVKCSKRYIRPSCWANGKAI